MCVCLCRYPLPLGRVHSHTPRGSLPAYSVFNLDSCINLILYNQVEGGWDTQTCSCRWLRSRKIRWGRAPPPPHPGAVPGPGEAVSPFRFWCGRPRANPYHQVTASETRAIASGASDRAPLASRC